MRTATKALLAGILFLVPLVVGAQELSQVNSDVADLVKQHPEIPRIAELIAKSLAGTITTVVSVDVEVGTEKTTTHTNRFVSGRIESISYNKDSGIANIVMIHNIRQFQTWKFQDNSWQPYNPDPQIEIQVK